MFSTTLIRATLHSATFGTSTRSESSCSWPGKWAVDLTLRSGVSSTKTCWLNEAIEHSTDIMIKTSRPENGPWKLNDSDMIKAIGRFTELVSSTWRSDQSTLSCFEHRMRHHWQRCHERSPALAVSASFPEHVQSCNAPSEINSIFFSHVSKFASRMRMPKQRCSEHSTKWILYSGLPAANLRLPYRMSTLPSWTRAKSLAQINSTIP